MKKQFYSFEELQKKKEKTLWTIIGAYIFCMSGLIATIIYFMAR